jgi:hypothetical protein
MTPDMIGHDRTVPDITGQSPDTIGQSPDTIGQQSDSHRTQSDIPDTTGHAGHNRTCRTLSNRTLSDIAEHGTVQSWSDIIGHSPDTDRTVSGQSIGQSDSIGQLSDTTTGQLTGQSPDSHRT